MPNVCVCCACELCLTMMIPIRYFVLKFHDLFTHTLYICAHYITNIHTLFISHSAKK